MQLLALPHTTAAILLLVLISGCSSPDDRILQQSLARQAEQNSEMGRHTREIIATTRQLVESDARARGELIELQQHLQDGAQRERESLDHQHAELDAQRKIIARQRERDPVIAAAIWNTGILLACLTPLLLAFWILRSSWSHEVGSISELLIHELVAETPILLPRPTLALPSPAVSPKAADA